MKNKTGEKVELKAEESNEGELQEILRIYKNYIEKFCELAERNVSLDEWGDEDIGSLSLFKKECVIRIAKKIYVYKDLTSKIDYLINRWFSTDLQNESLVKINNKAPIWVQELFNTYLPQAFQEYHANRKTASTNSTSDFNMMSGVEFESFVANILKQAGYNVSGTPATGDQGADLIASKNRKVAIIQVKRYSGVVGNKAIQEVVAAKYYYNGDVAAVVTNSSFTASAKNLARKNNVVLVARSSLHSIASLLNPKSQTPD